MVGDAGPRRSFRAMFGLLGFYRNKTIFAALPATRGIGAPNSINFQNEIHTAGDITALEQRSAFGGRA
jgi:hypothetical protein